MQKTKQVHIIKNTAESITDNLKIKNRGNYIPKDLLIKNPMTSPYNIDSEYLKFRKESKNNYLRPLTFYYQSYTPEMPRNRFKSDKIFPYNSSCFKVDSSNFSSQQQISDYKLNNNAGNSYVQMTEINKIPQVNSYSSLPSEQSNDLRTGKNIQINHTKSAMSLSENSSSFATNNLSKGFPNYLSHISPEISKRLSTQFILNMQIPPCRHSISNTLPLNNPMNQIGLKNQILSNSLYSSIKRDFHLDSLEKINLVTMAKDQNGCRFLQSKIDDLNNYGAEVIFPEVVSHLVELSLDSFGNYLVQKLFFVVTNDQLNSAVSIINDSFLEVSLNCYGTRVVQSLMDFLDDDILEITITKSLKANLLVLCKNPNGMHVISKFLTRGKETSFVYNFLIDKLKTICTDKHGCCIVQKVLDISHPLENNPSVLDPKKILIHHIAECTLEFIADPYANYVLQHVIAMNIPYITKKITQMFSGNLRILGKQKFSSNVIEKVLFII